MHLADKKLFQIQGVISQDINWEENGLRINVPQGTLSSADSEIEVTVLVLIGGQFRLPEGTELVSTVYCISFSKPLLRSVKLEIQHCAHLVNKDDISSLSFARAPIQQSSLPYQFQLIKGGQFYPGNDYGSISLSSFSFWAILKQHFRPSSIYVGKIFYEKQKECEWQVRFFVTKHLRALNRVCIYLTIHKNYFSI